MNIITSGETANGFDWKDKYNIWSGLIGGFFLALSYFGTITARWAVISRQRVYGKAGWVCC